MAIGEGILYGDILVENEDLFIDFFTKYYEEQGNIINSIIVNLISNINELQYILFEKDVVNLSLSNSVINNLEENYKRF